MIPYSQTASEPLQPSAVKIIGLGGAGANMLERISLDGLDGAELLALNTDIRTLESTVTRNKIQLGVNLTKGLGTGGDPELGHQAVLEAEDAIRSAVSGRRIVFLCTGLGGGTGSGAAPIVTRIAREEGAFVVVFATMPFAFEGKRRRDQAETSLNELAVLANALVTFDNNRMGELVLAKQGIHEAFTAADAMICESIKAVIRLVVRPGLINVGLDDLMSALRTNRSRCLFGSGIAQGKDRAAKALRNALSSPLLDQGSLLNDARTVLVHLAGGQDLTLYEIELLMQQLQKHVPDSAHVLFGAAVDPAMGDSLSLTLISALPEDALTQAPRRPVSSTTSGAFLDPSQGFTESIQPAPTTPKPVSSPAEENEPSNIISADRPDEETPVKPAIASDAEEQKEPDTPEITSPLEIATPPPLPAVSDLARQPETTTSGLFRDEERPFAELTQDRPQQEITDSSESETDSPEVTENTPSAVGNSDTPSWETTENHTDEPVAPKLKLGAKPAGPQNELSFDSPPRGRFEGEKPNLFEGEDLDLPPFLRKKR